MLPKISLCFTIILVGTLAITPVFGYDTHRYVMDDARLIIYPVNVSLGLKQKHAILYDMAQAIQAESNRGFAEFIRICLEEQATMYEEQALHSGEESSQYSIKQEKSAWRNQLLSLANELYLAADTVNPGMELDVDIDDTGELLITVGEHIYILSNPLINQPYALDERIIKRVCQLRYCNPDLISRQEIFNKRTITIEANWIIARGQKPEYSTRDGLHFVFDNLEQRSRKQIGSLKLAREIKLIAESLKEAVDKGVLLDWEGLTIKQYEDSYDYRIQLNRFSDSLYLHLPELHHVDNWQEKVLPWIKGQVTGAPVKSYLDGEKVLAYVLHQPQAPRNRGQ